MTSQYNKGLSTTSNIHLSDTSQVGGGIKNTKSGLSTTSNIHLSDTSQIGGTNTVTSVDKLSTIVEKIVKSAYNS
jgi:hypothetical protein